MAKIACCAIVKNEEEILKTMLDNVKPLVDEYVICDTGSTDKTKEIISEYGEVYERPFTNFVDSKNYVLDLVKEKDIDYILWMDADERIYQNISKLRDYAEQSVECVSCKITEGPQDDSIIFNIYDRCRMWKNNGQWRFYGPNVHEVICGNGEIVFDDTILVRHEHLKSDKGATAQDRFAKYVQLLTDYINEHPTDTRAWFYLARTHKDMNNLLEAISCYDTYLNIPNNMFRDEIWQAYFDGACCWKELGEYEKAKVWLRCAIQVDDRRSEAYNLLGLMAFNRQDYDEAIDYYKQAIKPVPTDVRLFLNPFEYDQLPKDQLVLCYYKTKQFDKAEDINKQLIHTLDQRILNNLWWCRTRTQMKIFMTLGLTPEPIYGGMIEQQGVHGVETTYLEMSEEFAKNGHDVFLFCTTEKEHIYKGVYYIPYQNIEEYIRLNPDVVITSRWFDALYYENTSKKVIWLQDSYFASPNRPDAFDRADLVVCSSAWHRDYIAQRYGEQVKKDKIRIIPLGIRKNLFVEEVERIPYKCIYSSNPDRGLYILADMWEELTNRVPGINLTVCYGWEGLKTWSDTEEWKQSVTNQQKKLLEKLGVFDNVKFTGRLKKVDLAKEFMSSEVMLYPNNFWETFCCHPDNDIFTDTGFKKITEVSISDKVLTHENRFRNIEKILSRNFTGVMKSFKLFNASGSSQFFTPEHPILSIKKEEVKKIRGVKYWGYSLDNLKIRPQWRKAQDLNIGDFVAYSTPQQEDNEKIEKYYLLNDLQKINRNYKIQEDGRIKTKNRYEYKGCPEYIDIDKNFARFLGLYFSEGSYSGANITFSLHAKEYEYSDFIVNFVKDILNLPVKVKIFGNQRRIDISSYVFGRWLESKIGHSAANKNIPDFMYRQSKSVKEAFIKGIFEGDANFGKNGIMLQLATKKGLMNLKMLMGSVGLYPSFSFSGKIKGNNYWLLILSGSQCEKLFNLDRKTEEYKTYFEYNGKVFYRIKELEEKFYSGKVYNFEVEEDNSYTSGFVTVHNCLSVLEAQIAGVPIITTDMGALQTTVDGRYNIKIEGNPFNKKYQNRFIDETVMLFEDRNRLMDWSNKNRLEKITGKCDWTDVFEVWQTELWRLM